jgi:hypothetical protein
MVGYWITKAGGKEGTARATGKCILQATNFCTTESGRRASDMGLGNSMTNKARFLAKVSGGKVFLLVINVKIWQKQKRN